MSLDNIYYGQPVNRSHPLTRGLIGWWKVLPWWASGPRWIDLCNRNHGTLTDGASWSGKGGGSIAFDGTNDHVVSTTRLIDYSGDFSGVAMFQCTVSAQATVFGHGSGNNASDFHYWQIAVVDATTIRFSAYAGTSNQLADGTVAGAFTGWHQIGFSRLSGTVTVYFDGASAGSGAVQTNNTADATYNKDYVAYTNFNTYGGPLGGNVSERLLFNRALSASEFSALYQESRRNSPSMLSRLSRTVYSFSTGAAPATYNQLCLLGVGA